jgi:hypothetical protein
MGSATPPRHAAREEAALAARAYGRLGALDLHGFARLGRHTGASVGAALSWVAGDSVELHASARCLSATTAGRWPTRPGAALSANPWQQATLAGGTQWLVGGQWTGGPQLSVLVEAWHDGTALSDAAWRDWGRATARWRRSREQPARRAAVAGNLAWQATPFDSTSLRRDNLFLRLAWQPADWTVSVDALLTPADRGHVLTAAVQWKGDRWRLDASWRAFGGPPWRCTASCRRGAARCWPPPGPSDGHRHAPAAPQCGHACIHRCPPQPAVRSPCAPAINQAVCLLIAVVLWLFRVDNSFWTGLVFSLLIGNACWLLIDVGRLVVGRWLYARRGGIPDWPGWPWMAPIVVLGTLIGYTGGHALAKALLGLPSAKACCTPPCWPSA